MSALAVTATALSVVGLIAGAPVVVGAMRQVRARLEGRAGAGIGQPWRDLRKLLRKQNITPAGTTLVFALAPAVVAATTLLIAAIVPLLSTGSPLDSSGDLIAVVGLLFLGTVALTLAGLDTGTAFGGMAPAARSRSPRWSSRRSCSRSSRCRSRPARPTWPRSCRAQSTTRARSRRRPAFSPSSP